MRGIENCKKELPQENNVDLIDFILCERYGKITAGCLMLACVEKKYCVK